MTSWRAALAAYRDPRVVAILFLGFSSGLPLALTGQTLAVWLKENGVSLTTIGLFSLVGLPYVFKFVWAPAMDAVRIPLLYRFLGRRRAWLVTTQTALILSILALGSLDPASNVTLTAAIAILVAFCSASQDVVIDAFRVESVPESGGAAAMANYVAAYRVALLVSTAGMFEFVSLLQASGFSGGRGWFVGYAVMAALVLVGTVTALAASEPEAPESATRSEGFAETLRAHVVGPFLDFATRDGWLAILLFVTLFKFGDAFAGIMTAPFVLDIGFDKTEYGRVVKLFGFVAVLLGGYVGGSFFRMAGVRRSLWTAALVQMISNLMFVWLALVGRDMSILVATVAIENFAGGFGTVVFVAFISALCTNRAYTATQFALLSALSAVGRTVLSSSAGWFADLLGWPTFFVLTTLAALPGIVLLWLLIARGVIGDAEASRDSEEASTAGVTR